MNTLLKNILLLGTICTPIFLGNCGNVQAQTTSSSIDESVYTNIPFDMPRVKQPVFADYSVSIADFGAVSDGVTLNTEAINQAIAHVHEKGGGKVIIPAGLWYTGPIQILSNVNLYTEHNSLILFTDDFDAYPIIETSFEGLNTRRCQSPLWANNAENIAITGYGVFDGAGDSWRPVKKNKMTNSQWSKLVKSGGVVDNDIWHPTPGALKGALATKDFNNPEGIETDEEWAEIRPWLRPVLLSFINCKKYFSKELPSRTHPAGVCTR